MEEMCDYIFYTDIYTIPLGSLKYCVTKCKKMG